MSDKGDNAILESETSFEDLLGRAATRPMPSAGDTEIARSAVRAEWRAVTHKRKRQRRFISLAAAASVLLVFALVVRIAITPPVTPVQVASIDKSIGSIYVLGEQSRLQATGDLSSISAGQTIVTGKASGLGLAWGNGGSLRIDANSRVAFLSASAIELVSGRMYFDSMNASVDLDVQTEFGVIRHLGTQYIGHVDAQSLSVSVREGRVAVDGLYFGEVVAEPRQSLTIIGNARPQLQNISPYGDEWRWIELTAPPANFNGKTIYELLLWVARETGLTFEFDDPDVESLVRKETLKGLVDTEPRTALRQGLLSADLGYDINIIKGVIHIADLEARHD